MLKIDSTVLRAWGACPEGFAWFCKIFPEGADLETGIATLVAADHESWARWLFNHCQEDARYKEQTLNGYRNTGDRNTGYSNTGDRNTGDSNTGDSNTGNWNTGNSNTRNSNTGNSNTGNSNTGNSNTGYRNTGNWNTGNRNTGNWNTGNSNTGNSNTGNSNTGYRNTGYRNTGNWNTGDWNTGNWNTGDRNTGYFNTITPTDILVFNKPCPRSVWDACTKPAFITNLVLTWWKSEGEMTDAEKQADPNFYMRGGQLRSRACKEAWKLAYDAASDQDKALLVKLPNFDADVFLEISGIDVRL